MSAYASIAAQVRLDVLKLVYSEFEQEGELSFQEPLKLAIETRWLGQSRELEQKLIAGICEWSFSCTGETAPLPNVKVVARYRVQYGRIGDDVDVDVATALLHDVGRMAVYPYFRAHVALTLSEAGLPLPPLPSINIGTFQRRAVLTARIGGPRRTESESHGDPA